MGLLIPHFTAPSPIHGTGLFTRDALEAGTILWVYQPSLDQRVGLHPLDPHRRKRLLHHGYINPARPGVVVVCGDLAKFWNFPNPGEPANAHPSEQIVEGEAVIVASRAIAAGEELLIHPSSDADYLRKMRGRLAPPILERDQCFRNQANSSKSTQPDIRAPSE